MKIWNLIFNRNLAAPVVQPPVVQKVVAQKVKVGTSITLTGNLHPSLKEEGSKWSIRDYNFPKGPLTIVSKQPEKSPYGNPSFLIKLEDSSGRRYNLRVSQETKLLVNL